MTIFLSGIAQFNIDNFLIPFKTKSKIEFEVIKSLRDKVFPGTAKKQAAVPNGIPGQYSVQALMAFPVSSIEISEAEVAALRKVLEEQISETGPGVMADQGEWFYPLLDSLQKESKDSK